MSGCGCGGCGCATCHGFSWAAGGQPWLTNQFGQIPPVINCAEPSGGGCSLRDANLACIANQVADAFFTLYSLLTGHATQLAVLDTQKPLLLTAMKELSAYTCDIDEIFERDQTVTGITNAIKNTVLLLDGETGYAVIKSNMETLIAQINFYFQQARTWM